MANKTRHLSKTDLRRGLFTKAKTPPAPVPANETPQTVLTTATTIAEQALLFDLAPLETVRKTRPAKSLKANQ